MNKTIELLKRHNQLRVIEDELDIYLEIPHIAYVEVKKPDSKALLFTNAVDKKSGKKYDTPILMNIFANYEIVKLLVGDVDAIADEIESLMKMKPPMSLMDKFGMLGKLFSLKNVFPKKLSSKGECQQIIKLGNDVNLYDIPVLTTWEQDGGPFITMGQVYTTSPDGEMKNLGMYRLQIYDKNHLGLHWQIHKDSNHFFHQYKKLGKKMPVSIAIGGDPLYTWCATAPLPHGVFELLMYGFIKNEPAQLVKSQTNDIYVPRDVDYVIEGWVDVDHMRIEGPFGDHTGYYTLEEEYPELNVTAITCKKDPIYYATVVGKPPLEDKYMGYPTERIFLPLLKTTAPDLIDYYMPESGVFHNLIMAKISPQYPAHAKQIMHAFWGVGQMSFVKHAIFVDDNAPKLTDSEAISDYILNRFCVDSMLISEGVCDALDHSSPKPNEGGKLGIDATGDEVEESGIDLISDEELYERICKLTDEVTALKQYKTATKTPICVIKVDKKRSQKYLFETLKPLCNHIKVLVIVDDKKNDINNPYMLVWRVANNIDARRDIYIDGNTIGIDATNKNELDNFMRRWPDDVDCTPEVLKSLIDRGILDIEQEFIDKYYL
jgi:4-hydroxy-3-polyprenylbenzoate decarboxylase